MFVQCTYFNLPQLKFVYNVLNSFIHKKTYLYYKEILVSITKANILYISDPNMCDSNPCQNGASCHSYFGGYSCTCATNYGGTNCQARENTIIFFSFLFMYLI